MEIQKTSCVVLSSRLTGEADYFIRVYTKKYGKRDFIFKGLRKSKRRPLIISEPGTIANLIYYFHEEKTSYIVNEYQIYKHYTSIRNSLKKILLLCFLLETAEKTTGFNDKNRSIFDLLVAGIDTLSKTENIEHLSVFFTLHLLKLHGILPDLKRCKICNRDDCSEYKIDNIDFHSVCEKCSKKIQNNTNFFSNRTREYIIQSLATKFFFIDHSSFPAEDALNFLNFISLFIENYFHIEIRSKTLLISEISKSSLNDVLMLPNFQ